MTKREVENNFKSSFIKYILPNMVYIASDIKKKKKNRKQEEEEKKKRRKWGEGGKKEKKKRKRMRQNLKEEEEGIKTTVGQLGLNMI